MTHGNMVEGGGLPGQHAMGAALQQAYDPAALAWRNADPPPPAGGRGDIRVPVMAAGAGDAAHDVPDPLSGACLTLRAWAPADLRAFRALLDDPQLWAFLPEPYPGPLDDETARALIIAANALPNNMVRAVLHQGRPIGQLRLEWQTGQPRSQAELSYWLGRAHWGAGIGSAMIKGAVIRAFGNEPALLRLIAKVHPGNPASARLVQKAGFTELAAPPDGHGFADWRWFALRRQHRPRP